jgi:hypothetical protein
MSQYRDSDAEKVQERRWMDIRSEWRNYVPDLESPWPVPEHEVYELPAIEDHLRSLGGPEKRDSTIEDEIEGLRVAAIQESVILVHKAGNVLRAAAEEGGRGFRTWSRSSSYHAAFFAMRGVLGLLGVMVFRGSDRQSEYQVDIWAPRLKKKKPGPTESQFAVRIIRRKRRVEHKEMWGLFSRVLRVTKIDNAIWPLLDKDPLKTLDPGQFSHVRHQIHYRSAGWIFEDLDSLKETDDFAKLAEDVAALKHLDAPDEHGFPPALALHTLSLGVALLQDLGQHIPKVQLEAKRAQKWMASSPWMHANAFVLVGAGGVK